MPDMTDDELRRALWGLAVAISLTPLPNHAGMGHIRDRQRALKLVEEATGFTREGWWQTKKAHMPDDGGV